MKELEAQKLEPKKRTKRAEAKRNRMESVQLPTFHGCVRPLGHKSLHSTKVPTPAGRPEPRSSVMQSVPHKYARIQIFNPEFRGERAQFKRGWYLGGTPLN